MDIEIKRVYEQPAPEDGFRVLVDRLWPRGLSKAKAKIDFWARDLAPSGQLREDFHAQNNWRSFKGRYHTELKHNQTAVDELLKQLQGHRKVTLLYASHDEVHNNAVVLKEFLTA